MATAEVKISSELRNKAIFLQRLFRDFQAKKKATLANLTWMTGSDGNGLLLGLNRTQLTLMPTGELLANGVVPFVGELGGGCSFNGVNRAKLSGVAPQSFNESWDYANMKENENSRKEEDVTDLKNLSEAINRRLDWFENAIKSERLFNIQDKGDADKLIYLTIDILRFRYFSAAEFDTQFKSRLEFILKFISDDNLWGVMRQKRLAEEAMELEPPISLDPNLEDMKINYDELYSLFDKLGYETSKLKQFSKNEWTQKMLGYYSIVVGEIPSDLTCDFKLHIYHKMYEALQKNSLPAYIMMVRIIKGFENYYKDFPTKKESLLKHLNSFTQDLTKVRTSFKNAVVAPIQRLTDEEITQLKRKTGFPLVLATTKKLPNCSPGRPNEVVFQGNLRLGEDIQLMITDKLHEQETRRFLRTHGLRSKVFVCTRNQYLGARKP